MIRHFIIVLVLVSICLTLSCKNDSIVIPPVPQGPSLTIASVSPNVAPVGSELVEVDVVGTAFTSSTSVDFGADVKVLSTQMSDTQHLHAELKIADAAIPGPRTVTAINGGAVAQLTDGFRIQKNAIPVASFTVDPATGTQNTSFAFDASASKDREGPIQRYHWEFGDGDTANGVQVRHKFGIEGEFRVQLTVVDADNAQSVDHKKVQVRFFDRDEAINDINDVVVRFLTLFGQIETLSAEQICVGFSEEAGCPGRQHEINIINNQKPNIADAHVDVFKPATVTNVNEETATASLTAHFYGTYNDGTPYDGVATHIFEMRNESEGWRICDFKVQ